MPIKKSSRHPDKAGIYRPPPTGSFAEKQQYFLASKAGTKVLSLIKTYDDLLSTLETIWRENNPYPITSRSFHEQISNHRCAVYRRALLLIATVPKYDAKTGGFKCPDECVRSRKEKARVRRRVKK